MTEQISALADSEIALEDAEHLMTAMQPNSQAADAWSQYHLIGDVMRGANSLSPHFKQNLMAKLELEPTVLSPNAAWVSAGKDKVESNDKVVSLDTKSKLPVSWSIAASFAAVMAVAWAVLPTQTASPLKAPVVAQATPAQQVAVADVTPALPTATEQTVPAEYLMAHQASAPSATSYYIQSASYSE